MNTFKRFRRAGAALFACALWAVSAAFAAVPERISYQGTLRKDGILFSGTVPMEFRITNFNGGTLYWTSNSTDVVVSGGLFRYTLGTPNEASFAAIDWNSVDAYVQVLLDGSWLPPEPLFSSAYALNAKTANNSQGDFTVRDGYIRLSTTTGNIGLVFQDGTTQYTSASPVWSVAGADVYISSNTYGNAGVGNAAPEARLDVQAAAGGYPQIWRDSSGVIQSSMSAAGFIFADGSRLRNLPSTADSLGSHIATQTVNMGGYQLSNAGAVTASSYTATNALGVGAAQLRLSANAVVSSATAAQYGGVYVSTNVSIAGKYYGDGSALSNLPIPANIMTLDTNQIVSGVKTVTSSLTVTSDKGLRSAHYDLAAGVMLSSASATQQGGVYVSSNIYITGKYYGDGSGLSGVVGLDNLGNHTLSQNMVGGAYWYSGDGQNEGVQVDASGKVILGVYNAAAAAARLDVRGIGADNYLQAWRNTTTGLVVSSMTTGGVLYAEGSGLRSLPSTITISSITTSAAGVVFSTHVFIMNGNVGISTGTPQEKLHVVGNIRSSSLSGAAVRCVHATADGVLELSALAGECGTSGATGDNLGDYTMTSNLRTNGRWISYNVTSDGLFLDNTYRLGIGLNTPAARLDVKALGTAQTIMAQIWRDSGSAIISSMSATGVMMASRFVGNGSGLTGYTLGNHIATTTLNMAGFQISNAGGVTASSYTASSALGIGAAQLKLAGNVIVSSETSPALGAGVRVSTNIYIVGFSSATKYYGDGSALTGLTAPSPGFPSPVTTNLNMAGYDLVSVSTISVSSITSAGASVTFGKDLVITNLGGNGTRCLHVDDSGQIGLSALAGECGTSGATGDNLGDYTMTSNLRTNGRWISYDAVGDGLFLDNGYKLGIGMNTPGARLDVQALGATPDVMAQIWRDSGGTVISSMSATGVMKAVRFVGDGSGLTGVSGSDNLGNHTATLDLNMASKDIVGISTISVSSITSSNSTVTFSKDVTIAPLTGAINRCVYADLNGVLRAKLSDCGTSTGGDEMGLHTMTQNLITGAYWISRDGGPDGLMLDGSQNLGIGVAAPEARLDLWGPGGGGAYAQIWRNSGGTIVSSMSAAGYLKAVKFIGDGSQLTGVSFNPILNQNMQAGTYWISGDGDNEGIVVDASGNVGVNVAAPGARLDVKAAGVGTYGQIWRDSSGVIQASMSGTGYIYADGSKLRNLPAADNLGNHTATANLNMGAYQLTGTGAVTVASYTATNALGIAAAQMRLAANTIVSSAPAAQYGGVYVSSNLYVAGKYYGDGSALANVTGNDGLGNHIATQTLSMAGYDIVSVSTISVSSITSAGGNVTLSANLLVRGGDIQSSKLAGLGTRCLHVDNSGVVSLATGDCGLEGTGSDNMGDHIMVKNLRTGGYWLSYDQLNGGIMLASNQNVGISTGVPQARLDVLAAGSADTDFAQIWRNSAGTIVASMTATGKFFGDGSGMLGAGFPSPVTTDLDMAGHQISNVPQLGLSAGVAVSSETDSALGAGLRVSSNVYIVGFSSAARYYGDGSFLTGVASGGFPSPVTTDLDMNGYKIVNVTTMTVSSITVPSGSGLVISTHTYILGNLSATKLYGNASTLSGIVVNPMTEDLNMNSKSIANALDVSATGIISGLKLKFVPTNLEISQANKPMGGLEISTHQYVVGSLMVSSHSTFGNTAPSPLTDTSLLLNETFTELTLNNIGFSAVALVNPAADPGPGLSVIGASFMAGIASGNAYSFDSIVGLKSGGWAQTNQTVTGSYGIFVQNMQSAGTVVNNYGVLVSSPDLTVGTITNNYGVFIKDHAGVGTTLNYNLFSAGLSSKNAFEGMVSIGDTASDSPAQSEPLQIKATATDKVMRIDINSSQTKYCEIKISNASTCTGSTLIATDNNMAICLLCHP